MPMVRMGFLLDFVMIDRQLILLSQSEKQFYLDQAKKLKDNFNSKYPDYVYRRRPNNSRRKRRADNGLGRPFDGGGSAEHHDDSASTEFDENSPVDLPANAPNHGGPLSLTETGALVAQPAPQSAPTLLAQPPPSIYTRHFPNDQALSPTYDPGPASASSHSSSSSYAPYSQHQPFNEFGGYHGQAQSSHAPPRLQSLQTHLPWPHDNGPTSSTSPITGGSSSSPGLPDSLHHHQYSSSSSSGASHLGQPHSPDDPPHHGLWGSSSLSARGFDAPRSAGSTGAPGGGSGGSSSSAWPMPPSLASVTGRQRSLTTTTLPTISTTLPPPTLLSSSNTKSGELFSSPSIPHRAWSNTPSSGSSSTSTTSTTGPGTTGLQFQTLTAPFFPGGQSSSASDARSASTSPQLSRDHYYSSAHGPTRTESGYDHHQHAPYPISPISPPHSSYFSQQQPHANNGGNSNSNSNSNSPLYSSSAHNQHSRLLHPIQTFSGPHAHGNGPSSREMASPLSAGPHSAVSHSGYWDRVEGR